VTNSPAATGKRLDRLVLTQAHCTALELGAAVLLAVAARRLTRVPAAWDGWALPLLVAGALATAAAVGPWVVARFTVGLQRALVWGGLTLAMAGTLGAAWEVDVLAYLALQMLCASSVLAELGPQRRALTWFWITVGVLVASFTLYHLLIDIQPRPE
jgi:hypothetical protein